MSRPTVKTFNVNTHRGKKASEIRQLKADALKRRMESLSVGEREVAIACGHEKRDVVSRWRAGTSWPYLATEEKLEEALKVPKGFFVRIGKGMIYDEALRIPFLKKEKEDIPLTHEQREKLASYFATIDKNWQELAKMLETLGVTIRVGQVGESKKVE